MTDMIPWQIPVQQEKGRKTMKGNALRKTISAACLLLLCACLAGCGSAPAKKENVRSKELTYTASGNEYRADVREDSASIEYLSAVLDIDDAEFVTDDFDDQTYLVLHMLFRNDSTLYRSEGNEDTRFYYDSLDRAFVILAEQDGEAIEPRDEAEAESFEEENSFKEIDSGQSLYCDLYFPVRPDKPVTVQVLNPDGEDTVMAELTFTPEEDR